MGQLYQSRGLIGQIDRWICILILTALPLLLFGCRRDSKPTVDGESTTGGRHESLQPVPVLESTDVAAAAGISFADVSAESGLSEPTWHGRPEKPHLFESGGSGLALFDYDLDGHLDVYVVHGWRLEGNRVVDRSADRLYRNRGDGTFEDVTRSAGLGHDGWGCGVAVGDYDNDGWPDLYVTNLGHDVLYRNQGDGTFAAVPGGPSVYGWSTGAVFFDADGDGDLDLFVAAYIVTSEEEILNALPTLEWKGQNVMFGPFGLEGEQNRYFENQGDGTFIEATDKAGLTDHGRFFSFTPVAFDMDDDGDLDLYVANDSNPQYLYRNDGTGKFEEVGLWSGAALDANGLAQAGMGVAVGDYNNDSLPDIALTTFAEDYSTLFQNQGRGLFQDVTEASGVGKPTYGPLAWGIAFADFELDGDADLFIVNGHIYPQANQPGTGTSYEQRNLVLMNTGGQFADISDQAGPGLQVTLSGRGLAVGDLDGDGLLDLIITNIDAPPTVLRNQSQRLGNWLMVDAPEALWVEVTAADKTQRRLAVRGGSYVSVSDICFHFGLGPAKVVDQVKIRWLLGGETLLKNINVDQRIAVKRDR